MIELIVRFNAKENVSENMVGICIERERERTYTRIAMNERKNTSEKMVGICIERERTREDDRYMYRERTHTRIAMNKREKTCGGNFCHI